MKIIKPFAQILKLVRKTFLEITLKPNLEMLEEWGIAYDIHFWVNTNLFVFQYNGYTVNCFYNSNLYFVSGGDYISMPFTSWYEMLDAIGFEFTS